MQLVSQALLQCRRQCARSGGTPAAPRALPLGSRNRQLRRPAAAACRFCLDHEQPGRTTSCSDFSCASRRRHATRGLVRRPRRAEPIPLRRRRVFTRATPAQKRDAARSAAAHVRASAVAGSGNARADANSAFDSSRACGRAREPRRRRYASPYCNAGTACSTGRSTGRSTRCFAHGGWRNGSNPDSLEGGGRFNSAAGCAAETVAGRGESPAGSLCSAAERDPYVLCACSADVSDDCRADSGCAAHQCRAAGRAARSADRALPTACRAGIVFAAGADDRPRARSIEQPGRG
jgi:hypothetical protein